MKAVNFWKTLFCAALAITAFTACSDDDDDNGNQGMPEIKVNDKSSVVVARDLTAGETSPAVTVVSKGTWHLSYKNESDAQWITPSLTSGSGTTTLNFTVGATPTAREAEISLTVTGSFEGIPITKSAKVIVKQNESGSTEVETNVKAIRDAVKGIASTAGAEITQDLTLTGIVISNVEAGGTGGNKSCYVVDNTTEAGAGIIVRFNSAYTYAVGQVIKGSLKGGKATMFNNILQVSPAADSEFSAVAGQTVNVEPIAVANFSELINYESQLVKFDNVQPTEAFRGKNWFDSTSTYSTSTFEIKTGGTVAISIYQTNTWAKDNAIPSKSGYICGIVTPYQGAGQIAPRSLDDVAGLTNELFTVSVDYQTSTIGNIKTGGNYRVENAVVAANYESGFVMEDASGQMLVYQFVKGATISVPAVGSKVTVQGTVESKNGMLQFSPEGLNVTPNGTGTVKPQTAAVLDGAAVTALFNAPVMKYVKYTGKLTVDGNYYNVAIDGTDVIGSISYPNDNLNVSSFNGKTIDVEGWFIGATTASGGAKYLTTLATAVSENANVPSVNFTSQPTQFAASNPAQQTLNYTANAAAGAVSFTITGTNADKFAVVSNTASTVVIKAVGDNTGTTAYSATLKAAGANGGEATVALSQAAPVTGNGYSLIDKVANLTPGTYYMAGYSTKYNENTFAPYSYHLWVGKISSTTVKKADLQTVNYNFDAGQLILNPDLSEQDKAKGTAANITLEAVSGKSNTYFIKVGPKYLKSFAAENRSMTLSESSDGAEWAFADHGKGGIQITNEFEGTKIILGTGGATYDMLRSYKSPASSLVYGVCFFKAN